MKTFFLRTFLMLCLAALTTTAYADSAEGTVVGKKTVDDGIEWTMGDKDGTKVRTSDKKDNPCYLDMQYAFDRHKKATW